MLKVPIFEGKTLREWRENLEKQLLSPYATLSANTRGRKKNIEPCQVRTEFQRDRDRILYCKAFRRLKHKTQVFIAPEGDHYRTRLTHTLEVTQIARTIARALRLNEDLTEAIALGHDLGHPPFGHAGEEVLDEVLKEFEPQSSFRHNEQSLRVVDYLEGDGGLNLTFEVRDGILNHTKGRDNLEMLSQDMPATLEGEVVRIADRLAYINHDIDDAIRGKIISQSSLPQKCIDLVGTTCSQRINAMITDIIRESWEKEHICMSEQMLQVVETLKEFLFETVYLNSAAKKEDVKSKALIKRLFYYYMESNEDFFNKKEEQMGTSRARIICDYIAGMTDRYALNQFERIFVPRVWQLQD